MKFERNKTSKQTDAVSFATIEAYNACQQAGTTSDASLKAAFDVFINSGMDAPYLSTQSAAIEAAQAAQK